MLHNPKQSQILFHNILEHGIWHTTRFTQHHSLLHCFIALLENCCRAYNNLTHILRPPIFPHPTKYYAICAYLSQNVFIFIHRHYVAFAVSFSLVAFVSFDAHHNSFRTRHSRRPLSVAQCWIIDQNAYKYIFYIFFLLVDYYERSTTLVLEWHSILKWQIM